MGYVAIELLFNYLCHIFFIFSCISIAETIEHRLTLLVVFIFLSFVSFILAFRILEYMVLVPAFGYVFIFYILSRGIANIERFRRNVFGIGLVFSVIWFTLDRYLFN